MRLIDADKGLRSKIQLETGCNFATADRIVESRQTAEAIPLDRIKEAREEMAKGWHTRPANRYEEGKKDRSLECMHILDKLIAEVEDSNG